METVRDVHGEAQGRPGAASGELPRLRAQSVFAERGDRAVMEASARGKLSSVAQRIRNSELNLLRKISFERDPGIGCEHLSGEQFNRLYLMRWTGFRSVR